MNRVAIVDDSEINLTLLKSLVEKIDGCQPLLFRESPEGLVWCSENKPDLIILDYMMPDLDGLQFVTRFRQLRLVMKSPC